jgi:hypothetical protein
MLHLGPDSAMNKGISTTRRPAVEDDHLLCREGVIGAPAIV